MKRHFLGGQEISQERHVSQWTYIARRRYFFPDFFYGKDTFLNDHTFLGSDTFLGRDVLLARGTFLGEEILSAEGDDGGGYNFNILREKVCEIYQRLLSYCSYGTFFTKSNKNLEYIHFFCGFRFLMICGRVFNLIKNPKASAFLDTRIFNFPILFSHLSFPKIFGFLPLVHTNVCGLDYLNYAFRS